MHKSSYFNSCTAICVQMRTFALLSGSKFIHSSEASDPTSCAKSSAWPGVKLWFFPRRPSSNIDFNFFVLRRQLSVKLLFKKLSLTWGWTEGSVHGSNVQILNRLLCFEVFCDTQRRMRRYSGRRPMVRLRFLRTDETWLKIKKSRLRISFKSAQCRTSICTVDIWFGKSGTFNSSPTCTKGRRAANPPQAFEEKFLAPDWFSPQSVSFFLFLLLSGMWMYLHLRCSICYHMDVLWRQENGKSGSDCGLRIVFIGL